MAAPCLAAPCLAAPCPTLTKAPRSLTGRQKRAAASIGHMWMREDERMDPKLHTYNRYGVQAGQKMPLWGGPPSIGAEIVQSLRKARAQLTFYRFRPGPKSR